MIFNLDSSRLSLVFRNISSHIVCLQFFEWYKTLNIPELLQRLITFSRNVFCGATSPRLTTGMSTKPRFLSHRYWWYLISSLLSFQYLFCCSIPQIFRRSNYWLVIISHLQTSFISLAVKLLLKKLSYFANKSNLQQKSEESSDVSYG